MRWAELEKRAGDAILPQQELPAQNSTVVQNNDVPTTPTNQALTEADNNDDNIASDVKVTSSMACTDGLLPSVRHS